VTTGELTTAIVSQIDVVRFYVSTAFAKYLQLLDKVAVHVYGATTVMLVTEIDYMPAGGAEVTCKVMNYNTPPPVEKQEDKPEYDWPLQCPECGGAVWSVDDDPGQGLCAHCGLGWDVESLVCSYCHSPLENGDCNDPECPARIVKNIANPPTSKVKFDPGDSYYWHIQKLSGMSSTWDGTGILTKLNSVLYNLHLKRLRLRLTDGERRLMFIGSSTGARKWIVDRLFVDES
jgi:hypothetical protein